MHKVKINQQEYLLDYKASQPNQGIINNQPYESEWTQLSDKEFLLRKGFKNFRVSIPEPYAAGQGFVVRVNGKAFHLTIKSEMDLLLEKMGMNTFVNNKLNELKAPMPGLILRVLVEEGQAVEKGTPLIALEAMKMENIIKATDAAEVGQILVKQGMAVEKNQKMITFK